MHLKQLQLHMYNTKKPTYVHDDDLNLLHPPHFNMANQRFHRRGGSWIS
jgi:hypothetical protein